MAKTTTLTVSGAGGDPATWGGTATSALPVAGDTILLAGGKELYWDAYLSAISPSSLTLTPGTGTLTTTITLASGTDSFTLPIAEAATAGILIGTLTGAIKFQGSPNYLERTSGTTVVKKGTA